MIRDCGLAPQSVAESWGDLPPQAYLCSFSLLHLVTKFSGRGLEIGCRIRGTGPGPSSFLHRLRCHRRCAGVGRGCMGLDDLAFVAHEFWSPLIPPS